MYEFIALIKMPGKREISLSSMSHSTNQSSLMQSYWRAERHRNVIRYALRLKGSKGFLGEYTGQKDVSARVTATLEISLFRNKVKKYNIYNRDKNIYFFLLFN